MPRVYPTVGQRLPLEEAGGRDHQGLCLVGSPGMWPGSRLQEVASAGEGGANQQGAGTQSDWPWSHSTQGWGPVRL